MAKEDEGWLVGGRLHSSKDDLYFSISCFPFSDAKAAVSLSEDSSYSKATKQLWATKSLL